MTTQQQKTINVLLDLIQQQTGENHRINVVSKNKYTIEGLSYNCDAQKTIYNLAINVLLNYENANFHL
jgi:hypothetical protein